MRHVDVNEYFTHRIPSWIIFFKIGFQKIDYISFDKLCLSWKLQSFHSSKSTDQIMNNEGKSVLITNKWLEWDCLCWQDSNCGTAMLQWHKKSGMRPSTLKVPTMTDERFKRIRKKNVIILPATYKKNRQTLAIMCQWKQSTVQPTNELHSLLCLSPTHYCQCLPMHNYEKSW